MTVRFAFASLLIVVAAASNAAALTPFFEENFDSSNRNWTITTTHAPATFVATGGSDGGGYISRTVAFSSLAQGPNQVTSTTLFRAQDENNASDQLYLGNWLNLGVKQVSFFFRHNATEPLIVRSRFSSVDNFPGAVPYVLPEDAVEPNVWTKVVFDIDPTSPQYMQGVGDQFEGSTFNDIFDEIGHIQPGIAIPAALVGSATPFTFDLDQVQVLVPEPATAMSGLLGIAALQALRRRVAR